MINNKECSNLVRLVHEEKIENVLKVNLVHDGVNHEKTQRHKKQRREN